MQIYRICADKNNIRIILEWNPDDTSIFIQQHKKNWKQTVQKYGIEEENARNIFVNRWANFTLMQMQKMAEKVNLEEWFRKECPIRNAKNAIIRKKKHHSTIEQTPCRQAVFALY